jgi:hypothetical protein
VLLKLVDAAKSVNPQADVIPYSAITGHGLDRIMSIVRSGKRSDRQPVDIDYDTYAKAEAELGWYNGTFGFQALEKVDAYELATKIIRAISLSYGPADIAHAKLMLTSDSNSLKMSAVFDNISVDGIKGSRYAQGKVTVVLNARVVSAPKELQTNIRKAVFEAMESTGYQTDGFKDECFSPSRPNPTHRLGKTSEA